MAAVTVMSHYTQFKEPSSPSYLVGATVNSALCAVFSFVCPNLQPPLSLSNPEISQLGGQVEEGNIFIHFYLSFRHVSHLPPQKNLKKSCTSSGASFKEGSPVARVPWLFFSSSMQTLAGKEAKYTILF